MQTIQGFKNTDAGLIPDDWNALQVRDVCRLINGRGFKPYEWSDRGLPIIRIQNLNGSDNFNYYQGHFDQKILIQNGQLLFAWSGSRGTSFGPHLWTGNDAVLNYHTWKIVANGKITKDYLYFALKGITSFIEDNAHGASALVHTQKWEMEGFYLAVPPADEQVAIAGALRDADEVVSNLERLIAKKQAIRQGLMQQLLTGMTRLPGFHDEWRKVELGEIAEFSKGAGLPKSAISANGSTPCVHYGELFTHYGPEIDRVTSATVPTGRLVRSVDLDVLMPTSDVTPRGLAKASAIHGSGVILGGDILIIRSDASQAHGPFIAHAIRQDANQVLQLVRGSTVFHLYAADMKNFSFSLPGVEEQRAIAHILSDAGREIETLLQRLAKVRHIKAGMMQELLTGRTRLPPAEIAV